MYWRIHGDLDDISYPLIQGLTIKGCSEGKGCIRSGSISDKGFETCT